MDSGANAGDMMQLYERECERCKLMQFFALEYQRAERETNVWGGWIATQLDADQDDIETDYTLAERCRCPSTDMERNALERVIARNWE